MNSLEPRCGRKNWLRAAFVGATLAVTLLISGGASFASTIDGGHTHRDERQRNELTMREARTIRRAAAQFRDVGEAIDAGYTPMDSCMELPGVGAAGYHFMNRGLFADGLVDPRKPEGLFYAKNEEGEFRLVGVSYMAPVGEHGATGDAVRPSLWGHPFDGPMSGDEMGMPGHYFLHAWVFVYNPLGSLAEWNPRVTCDES